MEESKTYEFNKIEKNVLKEWENNDYFRKLVEKNKNGDRFRFLDGPITANNPMGVHHAFGRTLKDITIRYNSMLGRPCQYQNGFDAQGLWVEVEVEKQMGYRGKRDILSHGMDKFTEECMARVQKYAGVITEQSKQLGQWMDWENSYFTNTDENILGIWHFLKICNDKGWLVKKHRVMSWCPRCGTSLSDHEMAGNFKEVTCKSVFFKMPLHSEQADLLVWTTTPWTLTSNVAVAVNPELNYAFVKVKSATRPVVLLQSLVKKILKGDTEQVLKVVKGEELLGKTYESLFAEFKVQNFTHKVIPWADVVDTEGTGLVHIAPGCGEEDFELGIKFNLPAICPIDEAGVITEGFGSFTGKTTVEVADDVFAALKKKDRLYQIMDYGHKYAHCWRCKTDIVFKLVDEWYIKSDEIRPMLLAAIDKVEWQPEHVKKRMANWLENMSDWNISRKRFYGLPLPFYVCEKCGKIHVIGSKEELIKKSSKAQVAKLPHLHRPFIDDVLIKCDCGAMVKRVPEVGDCWLDAGIAPFVTKKYFSDRAYWENNFPSEVVIEMVEQIRLWFYSLLFMSVAITGEPPYKKVVCYGTVVREDGEKFSKSAGKDKNIVLDDAINQMGADTIRYLYAGTSSVNDLRFGFALGDDAKKRINAFWNTYMFFKTYANIDAPKLSNYKPAEKYFEPSDKWVLYRVNEFVNEAKQNYGKQMFLPVLKTFEKLIDDINNWYIRINRKRFWKGSMDEGKKAGYWVLYQVVKTVSQIMAPIIPFVTDYIWHDIVKTFEPGESESVHLSIFPSGIKIGDYSSVVLASDKARDMIAMVQKIRNEHSIMIKQPLSHMYLVTQEDYSQVWALFGAAIKAETNIKEVEVTADLDKFMDARVGVNFAKAGRVLKQNANLLKEVLFSMTQAQTNAVVLTLSEKGEVKIDQFDTPLVAELFEVTHVPKQEFAIETQNGVTVVVKTDIDKALFGEYLVRTFIRKLQVLRKDFDFKIESRMNVKIVFKDADFKKLILENSAIVKAELLVDEFTECESLENGSEVSVDDYEVTVAFTEKL